MRYDLSGKGVCAKSVDIETKDGIVTKLQVNGGCAGWRNAVSKMADGKKIMEVIDAFGSAECQGRSTSCPKEIARILYGL